MKSEVKAIIVFGVGVGLVILPLLITKDFSIQQGIVTSFGMIMAFWGAIMLFYSGPKTKH